MTSTEQSQGLSVQNDGKTTSESKVDNWQAISTLFDVKEKDIFELESQSQSTSSTPVSSTPASSTPVHAVALSNGVTLITKGSFNVEAASQVGSWFQNFSDRSATIKFSGNGRWSYENGTYYSASGNSKVTFGNYNKGSLVFYRPAKQSTEDIGQGKEITLSPMELVYFRCNDDVFLDNMGSLTIDWELKSLLAP